MGAPFGKRYFLQIRQEKLWFLGLLMYWVAVSNIVHLHLYLGKISILTNIFQLG